MSFQRYDEEDKLGIPQNIAEWINATLDGDHPKFVSSLLQQLFGVAAIAGFLYFFLCMVAGMLQAKTELGARQKARTLSRESGKTIFIGWRLKSENKDHSLLFLLQ